MASLLSSLFGDRVIMPFRIISPSCGFSIAALI
jgi:hypothetical protein